MLANGGKLVSVWLLVLQTVAAIDVDWNSTDSIKDAASTMAYDMMTYYKGNLTGMEPGLLPPPPEYYWWEAGAMFGALVNYWYYTGDTTYNDVSMEAMLYQVGEFDDYMPQEQRSSLGNDDQAFWAITALQAVEYNFPDPPPGKPSWLGLVQAVFNEQVGRWDNATCNGGLRWQIYMKGGYNLKNTISNGCFFNIAARLARYTGEKTYADWAVKAWDWMWAIGLIDHDSFSVYDNSEADTLNCTELDRHEWSYNAGVLLLGAATMYNLTDGDPLWKNRTSRLLIRIEQVFFPNTTMTELCEFHEVCNNDQKSFKAYLARWMTSTTQLASFTYPTVIRLLSNSAKEAAAQCVGGPRGTQCGIKWWLNGTFDGTNGVGQQMSALEVTLGTLIRIKEVKPPVTGSTGGTSQPKPDAGHDFKKPNSQNEVAPPPKKDVIGGWFLTAVIVILATAGVWFLMSTVLEDEDKVKKATSEKAEILAAVLDFKRKRGGKGKEAQRGSVAVLEPVNEEDNNVPKYMGGTMVT